LSSLTLPLIKINDIHQCEGDLSPVGTMLVTPDLEG